MNIGISGFMTLVIGSFATEHPTNKTLPTGGVHNPMLKFITITIPNCTGSIPSLMAMGKNIGVKINTAGVISINVPTASKITFIISNITKLLSETDIRACDTSCGIFSNAITQDIAIEVAINNITIAVVEALLNKIFGKSLSVISL